MDDGKKPPFEIITPDDKPVNSPIEGRQLIATVRTSIGVVLVHMPVVEDIIGLDNCDHTQYNVMILHAATRIPVDEILEWNLSDYHKISHTLNKTLGGSTE